MKNIVFTVLAIFCVSFVSPYNLQVGQAHAAESGRKVKPNRLDPNLKKVCRKIRPVGSWMFWKNNKPIRASSAFTAPVIGYNRVPTFAYQKGYRGPLMGVANLYAANGKVITTMRYYSCRPDHCGGRVVGDRTPTAVARRRAVQLARSPKGYVQLSKTECAEIPDIGACYNVQRRGPCLGIEGK